MASLYWEDLRLEREGKLKEAAAAHSAALAKYEDAGPGSCFLLEAQ